MSNLVGSVLGGRYTLESKIGDGAMGIVYRARHARIPRSFAIKVLHKHLGSDAKLMKRFQREAELAGRLEHGNLVAVVDVGETDGIHFLVMELAEGKSLCDLLVETPMSGARVVSLVRQMCDGLHYAHELGLIHRDFKPENVIVSRDDRGHEIPRIVDFGIAILREQAATQSDRLTTAGLVLGTPHYMAPEQAMGAAMDPRVDLFALGVIVYELLTGKMPFDGSGVEVARANLLTPTPTMSARAPGVHVDPLLEAFTRKLLAKDKNDRPATAREARDLLDLIDRDRRAAAAALGVTLPAMELDHLPPSRIPISTPVSRTMPIAKPHMHGMVTEKVPRTRRRGGYVVGGVMAAAVMAVAIVAATRGSAESGAHAMASPPTVHMVQSSVASAKAPREATVPAAARAVAPVPVVATSVSAHVASHVVAKPVGSPAVEAPPITPVASEPVPEPAPVQAVVVAAPKPAPVVAPTSREVANLYVSVGRDLKAYSEEHGHDTVTDLWSRYRRIILNDVMATTARREAVTEVLGQIRTDLASR